MLKSKKGFTIVELVIVIAVIAILAAVLIPTFSSLIKKANDSAYLQERTNQQIADLAEKVENQKFLTWEDLEAKLAEEIAKIDLPESATPAEMKDAVEKAAADAIAEYLKANTNNDTALTEAQVKAIVEKALEGQLTTAQVEAIIKDAIKNVDGSDLTADQVKTIVDAAVAGLNKETGITKEEMAEAIAKAVEGKSELKATDVDTIIKNALNGFGYGNDLSASQIEDIIEAAMGKAVATADEMTVKELNDALNGKTATTIEEVDEILTAAGFNMENGINAIRSGSTIYWFKDYNKIVLANGDTVAYPTEDAALVAAFKTAYTDTSKVFNLAKLVDGSSVVVNGEIVGSIQDALNKGGEITLFNDIVAEDRLYIKADTVLNLNGHDIDFSSWTSGRLFNLETNEADLTINAEGSQIKFGGYGLVAMKGSTTQTAKVKVTINGGTFEGTMDNGAFIKPVSNVDATVELNNVTYIDKSNVNNTNAGTVVSYITTINPGDNNVAFNLKVNGGKYDADCGFAGFGEGEFKNVTITSRGYSIYGAGDFTVENSSLTTSNIHNVAGKTPAAAIAASGNVTVKVSDSTLNAGSGDAVALYSGENEVIITGSTITGGYSEYDGNSTVTVDGVAKVLTVK